MSCGETKERICSRALLAKTRVKLHLNKCNERRQIFSWTLTPSELRIENYLVVRLRLENMLQKAQSLLRFASQREPYFRIP